MTKQEFWRGGIIAGLALFLVAALLLLFFPSRQEVRVYDKHFHLVEVRYNWVKVFTDEPFKEKLLSVLAKLRVPESILSKLRKPPRNYIDVNASAYRVTPHETFHIYFRWPYPRGDLYAELVDGRGKTTSLERAGRGSDPQGNEKSLIMHVLPEAIDLNAVYTLRLSRSAQSNNVRVADIKIGRLGEAGRKSFQRRSM